LQRYKVDWVAKSKQLGMANFFVILHTVMEVLYTVSGNVRKGKSQGKVLGFPTANIALHKNIPEGIYASTVSLNGRTYNAVSFVGAAKTFNRKDVNVETYILDFESDLYGKWLVVKLHKFLRGNVTFVSADLLIEQMKEDVLDAEAFFSEQN
jgi:riboflavin kinase/FMN adenylyltransferase